MQVQGKAVIFDLGGVLVSFDHRRCYRALAGLAGVEAEEVQGYIEAEIRACFDRGLLTPSEVQGMVEDRFGFALEADRFRRIWADVFDLIPPMVRLLEGLQGRVRTALLSNTDPIHLPWVAERFGFFHCFETQTLSYECGTVKPEPAIFRAALDALALPPEGCLYIDDIEAYAAAARDLGMAAVHHVDPAETVSAVEGWLAATDRG